MPSRQLIPDTYAFFRLLSALLVIIAYLILLMITRPYKTDDVDMVAIATQTGLMCVFFSALCLRLSQSLNELDLANAGLSWRVLGFRSQWEATLIMASFSFIIIVIFVLTVSVGVLKQSAVKSMRMVLFTKKTRDRVDESMSRSTTFGPKTYRC